MYRRQNEELSRDLVLSIQRILDLNASPETDLSTQLETLQPIDIINGYFPMVRQSSISKTTTHIYQMHYVLFLEESLGQLDVVQVQLAKDEQDLQNEITQLQEELRLQQDQGECS